MSGTGLKLPLLTFICAALIRFTAELWIPENTGVMNGNLYYPSYYLLRFFINSITSGISSYFVLLGETVAQFAFEDKQILATTVKQSSSRVPTGIQ